MVEVFNHTNVLTVASEVLQDIDKVALKNSDLILNSKHEAVTSYVELLEKDEIQLIEQLHGTILASMAKIEAIRSLRQQVVQGMGIQSIEDVDKTVLMNLAPAGRRILKRLIDIGKTQKELCEELGINKSGFSLILQGKADREDIIKVLEILDLEYEKA